MRNFWVAIISVLMIASFAGSSFATAPIAQDIPDIKLLTTTESVEGFDLNDYVTDYDEDPEDLTWTIESQVGFEANPVSGSGNLVDIAASAVVDEGVVTYRVTDGSAEYDEDTQVIVYSTISMAQPALTEDNNLSPADTFPRTWIVMGDEDTITPNVRDLITPSSAAASADLSVSIADMAGNLLAGDGTATATYGDLTATINGSGQLVLSAPTGSYPLTGMTQLSGAYRVGVKAELPDGLGDANWSGMEVLASQSRFPTIRDLPTTEYLDQFMNFESVPTGALPVGFQAMKNTAASDNPRWYVGASSGTPTAEIVSSGIPASAWDATTGQALKVTLNSTSDSIFLQSDRFSDIQPGETLTFAANVTTSAAVDGIAPTFYMFMGNFQSTSNYEGLALKQGTTATGTPQVPVANEWRTIKATFTADEFGAAIDDNGTLVNVYAGQGYQAAFAIQGAEAGLNISVPMDVYIDNIRIYRDAPMTEKAFGATEVDVVLNTGAGIPADTYFDGEFEAADTLAGLGWEVFVAGGAAEIDVNASHLNNMFNHDGSNSLKLYFNNAATRGTTGLSEFVMADVRLNATEAGGDNNNGDGIYAMTAWFKTDATAPKDSPGVWFSLSDLAFKNIPFSDAGYAGAPLNGVWKKINIQSMRYNAARLKVFVIVRAESQDFLQLLALDKPWGSFTGENAPGYESDANVYVDDIQIHKYQDKAAYFDRSVFPTVD